MPARDEEQEIGKVESVGQARRQRMRLEMVDGDEGQPAPERDRLARDHADQQPSDQAWPGCGRDPVDLAPAKPRISKRLHDCGVQQLDMRARGDLGHHAAIARMQLELGAHHIGENAAPAFAVAAHQGSGRLVAARLDPEDHHRSVCSCHDPSYRGVSIEAKVHPGH